MAQNTTSAGNKSGSKKTTQKSAGSKRKAPAKQPVRREVGGIVLLLLGLFSFIGYFDIEAWFIEFFCGQIKGLIGWGFYIFPLMLLAAGLILLTHRNRRVALRVTAALLTPVLFGAMGHLLFCRLETGYDKYLIKTLYACGKEMTGGGLIGGFISMVSKSALSVYGAFPLLLVVFIAALMAASSLTPRKLLKWYKGRQRLEYEPQEFDEDDSAGGFGQEPPKRQRTSRRQIDIPLDTQAPDPEAEMLPAPKERKSFFNPRPNVKTPGEHIIATSEPPTASVEPLTMEEAAQIAGVEPITISREITSETPQKPAAAKKQTEAELTAQAEDIARTIEQSNAEDMGEYKFPPLDLLKAGGPNRIDGREEIALNRERLESTIHSFGVSASITNVTRGPTVTRYDFELEAGVKLNKLTNLAGDIALSLGVANVRIAPIPDKIATVGIEVPNKLVSTVYLRDIIDSPAFKNASSRLTFAIGEDIGGDAVVGNIAKLPHMLIAGTTGSGKSVCMNSLILSLLYKSTPDEVRLIMIDPKMVELGIYNGIPHLYVPVVTDPKKAAGALQWSVVEMLKRYRLFSECGVRDVAGYNDYQRKNVGQTIPQVVIVIDELADLMLVASKEVEESICRIAQMGRASGMHLVIATQRPSADVITGLMKANIPSRIAFAVSSALESRIILDTQGAEKLIGAGDMLYAPLGAGKPRRVQGAFVTDGEREAIIEFVKESTTAQYSDEIIAQIEKAAEEKASKPDDGRDEMPENDYDELLPQAVDVIFETKQASVSMLQRRLKLGYSRAARLIDQLEEIGVVGPFEGSKPRQILLTKQQWQEMQFIQGTAPIETLDDQVDMDMDFLETEDEDEL